jgi:2,4-dienoyl-CoA reductase-like NADH-dependent reductase (Old Yellow Enzyme family)
MSTDILFKPLKLGALNLPNRIVMPPLTRMRSGPGGVPTAINAQYYGQRASAGLNITEATAISVQGHGYPQMPGIHGTEQVEGWRLVTSAVHAQGGRIALQIVHHGRWSHSSYNPDGSLPVAPSAIAPPGQAYTTAFEQVPYETPRALETSELPAIVADFRQAARNARAAGFDAVEIHGANGFLLDQFLQDGSNQRSDAYGGNIENRARLLLEVVDGIADDIGKDRVGVRLEPLKKDVTGLLARAANSDYRSCSTNQDCLGRDKLADQFRFFGAIIPDLHWAVKDVWRSGDQIVVRGEATGTPVAPLFGTKPTGKSFRTISIDMFTVRNGKLATAYHVENWAAAMQQISQ